MDKHIETLADIRKEYAAYDNAHHQLSALDAAIALMRGQSEMVEWANDFELRALDVELSVGRTELEPGVHPRLPAHYRTRLQFGGPENPGNTVAFVFGNSSTERESRAMAEKMVAAYNAITPRPAQGHSR